MRETLKEIMQGVAINAGTKPRIMANNTVSYIRPDGAIVTRLHHTDIIIQHADGTIELSTGGWRTVTTKDRINSYSPARVHSSKGQWYIGSVPYFDGVKVNTDGVVLNAPEGAGDAEDKRKLAVSINKFCKKLDPLAELPAPSGGDCWLCMIHREQGGGHLQFNSNTSQTGPSEDTGHLLSHIAEGYIHGNLLMNALTWAGYKNPGLIFAMDNADLKRGEPPASTKRALRRYLRRKLSIG